MPRLTITDDKLALNNRIVQALANQCYWMELGNAPDRGMWAYASPHWPAAMRPKLWA